mgnify:CR=1 FL=1
MATKRLPGPGATIITNKREIAADDFFTGLFDTALAGNSNRGHEFKDGYDKAQGPGNGHIGPLLTHEERLAIIEHLKVRNDDLDGPQDPRVPETATGCLATAGYAGAPGYKPQAR